MKDGKKALINQKQQKLHSKKRGKKGKKLAGETSIRQKHGVRASPGMKSAR